MKYIIILFILSIFIIPDSSDNSIHCPQQNTSSFQTIVGFPSWKATDENISLIRWNDISAVMWAFALPQEDGSISLKNQDRLTSLMTEAKRRHKSVILGIGGGKGSEVFVEIFKNKNTILHFCKNAKDICDQWGFSGVQIDFEAWPNAVIRDSLLAENMLAFSKILRLTLPQKNYRISYDVFGSDWYGKHFHEGIFYNADYIHVMAMDRKGSWSESGDPSPLSFAQSAILYWKKRVASEFHAKLILVLPLYGINFSNQHKKGNVVSSQSYGNIVEKYGISSSDQLSLSDGTLWYNSLSTLKKKVAFAQTEKLAGVSFWENTFDSPFDSLSAIHNLYK